MKPTAYTNAVVLDGTKNMKPTPGSVLVRDGQIEYVGNDKKVGKEYKTIDLQGAYLLPGLINMHCHLPGSGKPQKLGADVGSSIQKALGSPMGRWFLKRMCGNYAKQELLGGVTTIRTVGGLGTVDTTLRNEINEGKRVGPRILAADTAVSVPGGHMAGTMAFAATSAQEAVDYVEQIAQTKPDLIKLMITGGVLDADEAGTPGVLKMPAEYVKAACDKAHELGFAVAAHVESSEGIRVALENGVDTIEHGAVLDDYTLKLFKEHHAKLICTLSPVVPMTTLDESKQPDPLYRRNGQLVQDGIISAAVQARQNGIPVGLGNDVGCPYVTHYDFWRELLYYQHYTATTAADALHAATQVNAQIAGIDAVTGTIEPGKSADFIVCRENPLENLSALRNLEYVVMRGKATMNPAPKRMQNIDALLDGCISDWS